MIEETINKIEMIENIKNTANESKKYSRYEMLTEPVKWCDFAKNKDYDHVSVHAYLQTTPFTNSTILFVGAFEWHNNNLESLDGDIYNNDMLVYGYEEWNDNVTKGIHIIVGDDW